METKLRKSAVDLTDLALGIIVLGIVVSIGSLVLLGVRDARLTDLDVVTTSNETVTPVAAVGYTLTNPWGIAVSIVTNSSGTQVINLANFTTTVSATDGTMTMVNGSDDLGVLNVTYTWYNISRVDWDLADKASIGLAEYGNWFKIIVIVGVAAVVLALIFMSFGRREGQPGGSY